MKRLLRSAPVAICFLLLQGCNVDAVARRVGGLDSGPHGPNAATGGVTFRVDGQADSSAMDEQITKCSKSGQEWTFSARGTPVLTLTGDAPNARVQVHTHDGDIDFSQADCSPLRMEVDASSGNGNISLSCDKAARHLGAGIRFAGCRE